VVVDPEPDTPAIFQTVGLPYPDRIRISMQIINPGVTSLSYQGCYILTVQTTLLFGCSCCRVYRTLLMPRRRG
jgi:hypothetical protein